ncbi:MAG: menaquinone biosynthesis protein [Phycisphaerales bacterium]|nr:menaquinone biosynthesis protein [Planctomycetota bacterium]MCH8509946.1 menaquinone biosynthesis protein [Phycisphaerales bacterium]
MTTTADNIQTNPDAAQVPTRIAAVSYLNTTPMIEGLDAWRGAELITAVPARLAGMVLDGRADVGLVSLADYARAGTDEAGRPRLTLLPCGMIGCDGPTLTVRVFSAVPPEHITTLHADTDSHTSVVLAQAVLAERHGVRPEVRDFHAREKLGSGDDADAWPETMLLIGDKVVTDSPPAVRYPYQIDLGEAWHAMTGLPFVYAVWMCRTDRADDPAVRTAADLIDRQRRRNRMRLDSVITAEAARRGWPGDLARKYIGELLRFEVDDRAREAVGVFLTKAAGLGLLRGVEVRWAG